MGKTIRPLKQTSTALILDKIRADASLEYRNRIPLATQAGVADTVQRLNEYRPQWNEFMDSLINRIGTVIAHNTNWSNPLAEFKRGTLPYGSTIEEIKTGLIEAHTYDPDREYMEKDIFGTHVPDSQSNFHDVNRQNYYPITVNQDLLKRAFLEEGGLAAFVTQLMEAPTTSDAWDEFILTCSLFPEYEKNGGFAKVHIRDVADLESNADDARAALRRLRAMAKELQFLSTKFNAAGMPSHARPEDLIILTSPEFEAAIDVEALAGAFHIDRAEMYGRVVTIPQEKFGIDGCQAILTTKDFFVIADQLFENTSQWNPVKLQNNYFLHHWQVISASRFVPAVMFSSKANDQIVTSTPYAAPGQPTAPEIVDDTNDTPTDGE